MIQQPELPHSQLTETFFGNNIFFKTNVLSKYVDNN